MKQSDVLQALTNKILMTQKDITAVFASEQ